MVSVYTALCALVVRTMRACIHLIVECAIHTSMESMYTETVSGGACPVSTLFLRPYSLRFCEIDFRSQTGYVPS